MRKKILIGILILILMMAGWSEYAAAQFGGDGAFGSVVNYLKRIATDTLPAKDDTYYLGSASKRWKGVYATLFTGALTGNVTGTASGNLTAASVAETNTGTSAVLGVTPDSLAGSVFGTKTIILKVVEDGTALPTAGDGKMSVTIPIELNGMNMVSVGAHVYTASDGGTAVNVTLYNATDTHEMLTTAITIDNAGVDSKDATTPALIDVNEDDVVTGDVIRVDLNQIGTNAKGLEVRMGFRLP